MLKNIFLFIILFILTLTFNVQAEEMLTWKDCAYEALKMHPELAATREKIKEAKEDKSIAQSSMLPQIETTASGSKSKSAGKNSADKFTYELSGSQLLFDGFKTSYEVSAASRKLKSVFYNYDVVSSNVRLRLRTAFVELLRAHELLAITKDIATRRKQNLELVSLRYDAGREHKGALLLAEADLSQALLDITEAKRNIMLSESRLIKELGRSNFSPLSIEGSLDVIFSDREKPNFEQLSEENPFLKELIAKKEEAKFSIKSREADFYPKVYATGSLGRTGSEFLPEDNQWSGGASISFPLFEGGRRLSQLKKSKSTFRQKEEDLRSGRDGVIYTLRETWIALQDSIDTVDVRKKFLNASRERAKIARAQYANGLISFDNWIIIEDDLVNDKKFYLDSKAEALISEAYWIQAKGETLDDAI